MMAIKERSAKQKSAKTHKPSKCSIEEKDKLIEINQSLKGITWDDSDIPTLTKQAEKRPTTINKITVDPGYSFEIVEDFLTETGTKNGHQANCTCIKCQPKKENGSASPLFSISTELGIQSLSKKKVY